MPNTIYIPGFRGLEPRDNRFYGSNHLEAKKKDTGSAVVIKKLHPIVIANNRIARFASTGTNEVQTLILNGTPTGGTFTLVFGAYTTTALNYNATAAEVQAALEALPSIGAGNVTVTGSAQPGNTQTITFVGYLSARNVAAISTGTNGLTGGTTPAPAHATTTAGVLGKITSSTLAGIVLEDDAGPITHWPREFAQAPINLDGPFATDLKEYRYIPIRGGQKFMARIEHDVAVTEAMEGDEVTLGYNVSRDEVFIASGDTSSPLVRITNVDQGQVGVLGGLVDFVFMPAAIAPA